MDLVPYPWMFIIIQTTVDVVCSNKLMRRMPVVRAAVMLQEYARDVVKAAKTDEAKSFGHVLLGNTYFLSAPHRRPGQKPQDAVAQKTRFEVCLRSTSWTQCH